jgi:hypothetical protein
LLIVTCILLMLSLSRTGTSHACMLTSLIGNSSCKFFKLRKWTNLHFFKKQCGWQRIVHNMALKFLFLMQLGAYCGKENQNQRKTNCIMPWNDTKIH